MIDPNDFVISRRRKKYKFAKFANSPLCYEFDEWKKTAVDTVEVGAGTALFSVELATLHPDCQFVAIDVKADRLQKGAYEAETRELTNIKFLRVRADQLLECFEEASVNEIWLNFADPFPKKGSAGRRMTHPTYLATYSSLLAADGRLCVKHDSPEFFQWTLEQLVALHWVIGELIFDLHESDLPERYKTLTSYERRWLSEGRLTSFVSACPLKA